MRSGRKTTATNSEVNFVVNLALEARIILGGESREAYIALYQSEILKQDNLKEVFTLAHKLEKTGNLTEDIRAKLNEKFQDRTTYFGNWSKSIDELPTT